MMIRCIENFLTKYSPKSDVKNIEFKGEIYTLKEMNEKYIHDFFQLIDNHTANIKTKEQLTLSFANNEELFPMHPFLKKIIELNSKLRDFLIYFLELLTFFHLNFSKNGTSIESNSFGKFYRRNGMFKRKNNCNFK